jgi:hypothetical protein
MGGEIGWRGVGGCRGSMRRRSIVSAGHSKEGSDGRMEMGREGLECILLGQREVQLSGNRGCG